MSDSGLQDKASPIMEQLLGQVEEIEMLDRLLDGKLDQSEVDEIAYEWGCDAGASADEIVNHWLGSQLEVTYCGRKDGDWKAKWHVTGIDILAAYGGPTIHIVRMSAERSCSPSAIMVKVSWWSEFTQSGVAAPRLAEFLDQMIELADEDAQSTQRGDGR
jgi:hypothetical protein